MRRYTVDAQMQAQDMYEEMHAEALYETVETDEYADAQELWAEEIGQMVAAGHPDFHVCDESSADWVANKIKGYEREREERELAWKMKDKELERKIKWLKMRFGAEMEAYASLMLSQMRGKKKSFRLPCGAQVGYRLKKATVKVVDQEAYEASIAVALPEALGFAVTVDKNKVNEAVLKDGIILDGVHVEDEHDEFFHFGSLRRMRWSAESSERLGSRTCRTSASMGSGGRLPL